MNKKDVYYKQVFYISMSVLALTWFLVLFLTGGYSARGLLYGDGTQTFMDFFNSMLYNTGDPYQNDVFYPPLATLFYKAMLMLVPFETVSQVVSNPMASMFGGEVKTYQQFMIPFMFYSIATLLGMCFALKEAKQGRTAEKFLFTFLVLLSAPSIFMFERANNIVIVLICTIIFVSLYKSEKSAYRWIALAALSVAIAVKLYPVAFCALLVKDKKYKDLLKVAAISAFLLIVPFFVFYDGFESLKLLFTNISDFGDAGKLNVGVQLNFAKMIILPLWIFNIPNDTLILVGEIFKVIVMVCAVPATFFLKKDWKCVALCCCIIYGYQSTCSTYLLVLFAIPAMLMLDQEKERSVKNYVYIVLLVLTLALIVSPNPVTGTFGRFLSTKISSYAVMTMTAMLCYDGLKALFASAAGKVKEIRLTKDKTTGKDNGLV